MAYKLILPKFGMAMESAKIIEWIKELGDPIQKEEAVLVVENEKLSSEIVSMEAGVLLKKVAIVGEKYQVGDLLAYVGEAGEQIPEAEESGNISVNEVEKPAAMTQEEPAIQSSGGRIKASPLARKIAADLGYDIRLITGSGPGGRIEKADVERYAQDASNMPDLGTQQADSRSIGTGEGMGADTGAGTGADPGSGPGPAPMEAASMEEYSDSPVSSMRQAIGANMLRAWTEIPMVTHHVKADVGVLLHLRETMNEGLEEGDTRVSVNDLLLKLCSVALLKLPAVNAAFLQETIRTYHVVHLGMAVALDQGLIVPVIHNAQKKSLLQISRESKDLADRAKKGTLTYAEIEGATFTVTNLGSYGSVDDFTPIVNPPQAAILGVGRTVETPVVLDGEICIRPMMSLSFTYDHRIIDGAVAAEFMKIMLELLANPLRALLTID